MATGRIPSTEGGIQPTTVDAKGDLIVGAAADTPARLAVGNNGETLLADSSTTTGLRWAPQYAAGKNYVINGNMAIDQRNSGAAVTINATGNTFCVDRFTGWGNASDGVYTLQRDTVAPAGFSNSLKVTVTTADASVSASQAYFLQHKLEGTSVAGLNFGSANAATVTLSFWVRSSLTGTFSGALGNSASNRGYPFTYSISSANTWERKSITIPGDTSGTWLSDTGIGIRIFWSLGAGSDYLATAGAWASANLQGATGETKLIGTLNATLYLTGVQLELGSVATPFSLSSGTIQGELAACQRYYWRTGGDASTQGLAFGFMLNTTSSLVFFTFPVRMRIAPTSVEYSTLLAASSGGSNAVTAFTLNNAGKDSTKIDVTHSAFGAGGTGVVVGANSSTSAYVGFSAEL